MNCEALFLFPEPLKSLSPSLPDYLFLRRNISLAYNVSCHMQFPLLLSFQVIQKALKPLTGTGCLNGKTASFLAKEQTVKHIKARTKVEQVN